MRMSKIKKVTQKAGLGIASFLMAICSFGGVIALRKGSAVAATQTPVGVTRAEMTATESSEFLYQTSDTQSDVFSFATDDSRSVLKIHNVSPNWTHDHVLLGKCFRRQ